MTSLPQLQRAFLDDLTGDDRDSLESLVLDDGKVDLSTRLGIYRNAYLVRLREALATDHEILQLYVGEQAFAELAEEFIADQPSTSYSLRHLGDGLAAFLAAHPRYGQLPVLAELAKFERLLLGAFDAASATRATLDASQRAPCRLRARPSGNLASPETRAASPTDHDHTDRLVDLPQRRTPDRVPVSSRG